MSIFKILFDACYEIFSYKINLLGFDVSLLNVFAFMVIASVCLIFVRFLIK